MGGGGVGISLTQETYPFGTSFLTKSHILHIMNIVNFYTPLGYILDHLVEIVLNTFNRGIYSHPIFIMIGTHGQEETYCHESL